MLDRFVRWFSGDASYTTNGILLATNPSEIVADADQDGLPDAPPPDSGYRPSDIQGIACWNCSHFEKTGVNDADFPAGICHLWEAQVQGQNTCDRFTADPTLKVAPPHTYPGEEGDGGYGGVAEFFYPSGEEKIELADDGLVEKVILRTGEWPKTPGTSGVVRKPMKIIRDGQSNAAERTVAMTDLVDGFDNGAYPYVTIPLTDEEKKDHKNILRLNTGFVRGLAIRDRKDGRSELVAKMEFTEPEVKAKVDRGTIPDISSGIFFDVERPDGKKFPAALNHAALTHRPFQDDLGAFGIAASDDDSRPIESFSFSEEETEEDKPVGWDDRLSFSHREEQINRALKDQLGLSEDYFVTSVAPDRALVRSKTAEMEWIVPFEADGGSLTLTKVEDWQVRTVDGGGSEEQEQEGSIEPTEPAAAPKQEAVTLSDNPLQRARQLRDLRSPSTDNSEGGEVMSGATDTLKGIDLSDPEKAKEQVAALISDNQRLRSQNRVGDVHKEIERVKGLGFAEEPGFLSVYRDILLSDDEEPAMILLSHDDEGKTDGSKERLTATEIANRLISSLKTDDDGKILLAQQHLASGNDTPPPPASGEERTVEERTTAAAEAIGQEMPGSKED